MKTYYKEINGKTIIRPRNLIVVKKNGLQIINPKEDVIFADGWKEYISPKPIESEKAADASKDEIAILKRGLQMSDYQVIKCFEAFLCGEEMPYDIKMLHSERNKQRQRINEIEGEV